MKRIIPYLLLGVIGLGAGWLSLEPLLDHVLETSRNRRNPDLAYNGSWGASIDIGSSRATALFRAIVAKIALGANSSDEAIYWVSMIDKDRERLTGGTTYEVRFSQPPLIDRTAGFWSLCVYNSRDQFVPNAMKRYNLSDRSPLVKNADGSFTIYISPRRPKEVNNWIPSPPEREPITLQMRMYAPLPEAVKSPEKSPMPEVVRIKEPEK